MELLDLQGMLILPGGSQEGTAWHCLAPLGLIPAAWAPFCRRMSPDLFFLESSPRQGKGNDQIF